MLFAAITLSFGSRRLVLFTAIGGDVLRRDQQVADQAQDPGECRQAHELGRAKGLGMGESIESRLKWIARDRQDRVERDLRLLWTRRNRLARSGAC